LFQMGRTLSEAAAEANGWHAPPAGQHGEQRWENGWSLAEVVRDYQILRLVVVEHLEEALARPLHRRETMAVGLGLDEAITVASAPSAATSRSPSARPSVRRPSRTGRPSRKPSAARTSSSPSSPTSCATPSPPSATPCTSCTSAAPTRPPSP